MKPLIIIGLVAVVGIGGVFLYQKKSANYSPFSKEQTAAIENKVTGNNNPLKAQGKKAVVDCSIYGKEPDYSKMSPDIAQLAKETFEQNKYVANDRGNLPADFPDVASKSSLCGSVKGLRSTYYLTSLTDDQMFADMSTKLKQYGCTVEEVQRGSGNTDLYYMPFACKGTKGLINNNPTQFTYGIVFPTL